MTRRAVYAGSFDPITYGHLDLIERVTSLFDEVVLAIAVNFRKEGLFTFDEREALMRECTAHLPGVSLDRFSGLTIHYAQKVEAIAVVRGLRAMSDFEFELQMALTNRKMAPDFETVFLMPHQDYAFLSSSLVKEIAQFGGDVSSFVPPPVCRALEEKFAAERAGG